MRFDPFLEETAVSDAASATGTGVEPGAEPAGADPAAPGADATVASVPEPAAPGSTPINWNDINVLQEAANHLASLGYNVVQAQPEPQEPVAAPEWDPFNPQVVDQRLASVVAPLQQQVEALQQTIQAQQAAQVNDLIDSRIELAIDAAGLAPLEGQSPEQLNAAVNALANTFAAQKVQALGRQPFGAEAARLGEESIADAVAFLNAYGSRGVAQGAQQYRNELAKDSNLLPEPGVNGVGREGAPVYTDELSVARAWSDTRTAQL